MLKKQDVRLAIGMAMCTSLVERTCENMHVLHDCCTASKALEARVDLSERKSAAILSGSRLPS